MQQMILWLMSWPEVPLFFWASHQYKDAHSDIIRQMNENKSVPINLENLFYGVAFLLNADFRMFLADKNIFSSTYLPPDKRKVLDPNNNIILFEDLAAGGPE